MARLPKIKQDGTRVYVLCDKTGTAKALARSRRDAEAQFCLLHHLILLERADTAKMRSYMHRMQWTIREVMIHLRATGVVYPILTRERVLRADTARLRQLRKGKR
jgi:hypothetical protein